METSISTSQETQKRLESLVQHILEAIEATESFIVSMDFASFSQDQKTIFAIERSVGIVGAIAKRFPISFVDRYPEVNWRLLSGIGDNLIYGYFETDLQLLWDIAQRDLPQLKSLLTLVLQQLQDGDTDGLI